MKSLFLILIAFFAGLAVLLVVPELLWSEEEKPIPVNVEITDENTHGQEIIVAKGKTYLAPEIPHIKPDDEVSDTIEQIGDTPVGHTFESISENNPGFGVIHPYTPYRGNRQDQAQRSEYEIASGRNTGLGIKAQF